MASLAASNVTVNEVFKQGGTSGRKFKVMDVTLALNTVNSGGLTNTIPASIFGMTRITAARNFRTSASVQVQACPSYDGTLLTFCTAETAGTPADQSTALRGIIEGLE